MGKQTNPTVTPDELDVRIAALLAEKEAKARQATEEAEHAQETARQHELADWRRLRLSTEERMAKDRADLLKLTDKLDRERAAAIDAFWKERA